MTWGKMHKNANPGISALPCDFEPCSRGNLISAVESAQGVIGTGSPPGYVYCELVRE